VRIFCALILTAASVANWYVWLLMDRPWAFFPFVPSVIGSLTAALFWRNAIAYARKCDAENL
jgi:hypothetical protein